MGKPKETRNLDYFYGEASKAYQAFHRGSNAKAKLAETIADKLLDYYPEDKKKLRILDVGCGGGELTHDLVKKLAVQRPETKIELTAIDPGEGILKIADEKLQKLSSKTPNLKVKTERVGIEPPPARLCKTLGGKSFDFVLASFIFFWVKKENWEDAIDQFAECLDREGLLCIVQLSQKGRCADFRKAIHKVAHKFPMDFTEIIEKVFDESNIDYDSTFLDVSIDLGEEYTERITDTVEFLLRRPRGELTPEQKKKIVEEAKKLDSQTLECTYKILCCKAESAKAIIKPTGPIRATDTCWHFIFPFLFDPAVLKSTDWLGDVDKKINPKLEEEKRFKKGRGGSRKGFLPILPYRSSEDDVRYQTLEEDEDYLVKYIPDGARNSKLTINLKISSGITLHTSGAGVVTYSIKPAKPKKGKLLLGMRHFEMFSRLIPKLYHWQKAANQDEGLEEKAKAFYEQDPRHAVLVRDGVEEFLHRKAEKVIMSTARNIVKNLEVKTEVKENFLKGLDDSVKQKLTNEATELLLFREELRVYINDFWTANRAETDEFTQPFVMINVEVGDSLFRGDLRELWFKRPNDWDGEELYNSRLYQQVINLVYRFWDAKACVAPWIFEKFGSGSPTKMLALNANLTSFVSPLSALNVYPQKPKRATRNLAKAVDFITCFTLPSLLAMCEKETCRLHFILVLDALLDQLIKDICKAQDLKGVEKYRVILDRYRMQTGMMLEEIGQHVKAGMPGNEISSALREVTKTSELEQRIMRKMELTDKLLKSTTWTKQLDEDIRVLEDAKKELSEVKENVKRRANKGK